MTASALKAVATDQVQRRPKTIFDYLEDARVKNGIAAVAGKFLTADRMLKLCINAVKKTPDLQKCDPQTVLGAMMASAALGLEPNTIQQQAFLIPYARNTKVGNEWRKVYDCQFQVGARGFVTLAYRSPRVKSLRAEAIHEGDLFEHMMGSENFLRFAKALKARGDLIGAFCHVHLVDGFESACVLPLEEIYKIRSKSETWRALVRNVDNAENERERARAQLKLDETPWVMWEDDMAAKSAIKKHAKQLPIASGDTLIAAAEIDNRGETGLDLKAMQDPDMVRSILNDGAEPPALENTPSETLEQPLPESGDRAQVQVPAGYQAGQREEIAAADRPDAGAEAGPPPGHPAAAMDEDPLAPAPTPAPAPARQRADTGAPKVTYARLAERLRKTNDREVALIVLDEGRALPHDQQRELQNLFDERFSEAG